MNKILLDRDEEVLVLDNDRYNFKKDGTFSLEIENQKKDIFLVVSKDANVVLNILGKNTNFKYCIFIEKDASLILNNLVIEGSVDLITHLEDVGASFILNYSILSSKSSKNNIQVKHNSSKTSAKLKNHGFSKSHANLIFDVSAYINKDTCKCISKQDNQIIENENSLSQINPNLYIENYDVEASHSAYVGEFKESELFYLMSRGLTEEMSKFLLLKSFLIGSFNLEEKIQEKYYHEVIKYFNKEV